MKAISVRQPWAYLIVEGIKRIENREWNTQYRGPLLIHAAGRYREKMTIAQIARRYRVAIPDADDLTFGAIIGQVDLIDVVTKSRDKFFCGPFGFVLANARPLSPHAMLGRSRLFDVSLALD
jgi:hypothetical protein